MVVSNGDDGFGLAIGSCWRGFEWVVLLSHGDESRLVPRECCLVSCSKREVRCMAVACRLYEFKGVL